MTGFYEDVYSVRDEEFAEWLLGEIRKEGSQRAYAEKHFINPQHLSEIVNGRSRAGKETCFWMGIKRYIAYIGVEIELPDERLKILEA